MFIHLIVILCYLFTINVKYPKLPWFAIVSLKNTIIVLIIPCNFKLKQLGIDVIYSVLFLLASSACIDAVISNHSISHLIAAAVRF
jgi:hypothetical protein